MIADLILYWRQRNEERANYFRQQQTCEKEDSVNMCE